MSTFKTIFCKEVKLEPYNYMINTLVQIEMPYGIGNIHIKTCTKLNHRKRPFRPNFSYFLFLGCVAMVFENLQSEHFFLVTKIFYINTGI